MTQTTPRFFLRSELQGLIELLQALGYRCVGPKLADDAIVYHPLTSSDELPQGIRDHQSPAHYRYSTTDSARQFAWSNGAQCLKPLVFKPRETLWQSFKQDEELRFQAVAPQAEPTAVIGVRSCDLAALALSDAHFLHGEVCDEHYRARREQLFLVAINCSHPAETCFCASTGDGPWVENGADLILDELDDGFVCIAASSDGEQLLTKLKTQQCDEQRQQQVQQQRQQAINSQTRSVSSMQGRLGHRAKDTYWNDIAQRCLSCGNCTSVCPSCFCNSQQEVPSLDLNTVEQVRQWDSCFHTDHSYIHGFVIRAETSHRYRQWLTHKFDYWHEQYGRSGCVGCGRCITWCPAAIDVTEELKVFAEQADD